MGNPPHQAQGERVLEGAQMASVGKVCRGLVIQATTAVWTCIASENTKIQLFPPGALFHQKLTPHNLVEPLKVLRVSGCCHWEIDFTKSAPIIFISLKAPSESGCSIGGRSHNEPHSFFTKQLLAVGVLAGLIRLSGSWADPSRSLPTDFCARAPDLVILPILLCRRKTWSRNFDRTT